MRIFSYCWNGCFRPVGRTLLLLSRSEGRLLLTGQVRAADKQGNDLADEAAELGAGGRRKLCCWVVPFSGAAGLVSHGCASSPFLGGCFQNFLDP